MPKATVSYPRNGLRRINYIELLLVAGFAALVGLAIYREAALPPEVRALADAYGPSRNSQHYEEWIIRDFFNDRREGFFLDVGANHYRSFSNTYYLETVLGWSGIAVEPLIGFEAEYRENRPRTRFRPFFVSNTSNENAKMYLLSGGNHLATSSTKQFTERFGSNPQEIAVSTITLDDLLDVEKISRIDFMSMDIELHEPKALAGFSIERFAPALVCIETHQEVRQEIIDYFTRHRYVIVGKYLYVDAHNLYFRPLDETTGGDARLRP